MIKEEQQRCHEEVVRAQAAYSSVEHLFSKATADLADMIDTLPCSIAQNKNLIGIHARIKALGFEMANARHILANEMYRLNSKYGDKE